jgi:arylsulfatase A-like enzyme
MRAIMLMFDTLNRRFLPPYGAEDIHAPNFERLRERTATFDNCYAGSMPCMPARREIHTGRPNFLHRSWGPLEPFDDSVPEMLSRGGVYTHLVTDHQHYWEDGGATYHNRYNSYEFFRGQEGDRWKGHVADPEIPESLSWRTGPLWRQDWINRQYMQTIDKHPQTKTVDAGLEFLRTNGGEDSWYLQIECFDPHEPFFSYEEHQALYSHDYDGDHYDWPDYRRAVEDAETVDHVRHQYASLLSMCDASLGRVLDLMDDQQMWDDTMLIVCTDHGLLLGEHGWWGKNVQPWFDENIHTPLFIWDPRSAVAGERRASLVQTVDFGPTLLDFFGLEPTDDMTGRSLRETVSSDAVIRESGLFGSFGGHVNVTDGRYVYMRAPISATNEPLHEYTLMPVHMASRFVPEEFEGARLVPPFTFTKKMPVLELNGTTWGNPYSYGTLLFDLSTDPEQKRPLLDDDLELRMAGLMVDAMRVADAPPSQFARLGLPATGPVGFDHLLARAQAEQVARSVAAFPAEDSFATEGGGVNSTVQDLLSEASSHDVLVGRFPMLANASFVSRIASLTVWQFAAMTPGIDAETLRAVHGELLASAA